MNTLWPQAFGLSAQAIFGLLSAALSVVAYAPYIRDTLRGNTHPHRACWFIWSVLASISFFSLVYEGASTSLYFVGTQALCTTFIFMLSLTHGQGKWITRADGLVLCVASVGLLMWALTDTAVYALGLSIAISLLGGTLTVRKAYRAPQTETLATWLLSFIAACAALASVDRWELVLTAYPVYLITLNGAIILAAMVSPVRRSGQTEFVGMNGGCRQVPHSLPLQQRLHKKGIFRSSQHGCEHND